MGVELEGVVWVAVLVVAYALISRRTTAWPVSGPMIFVAGGFALGDDGLGVLGLQVGGEEVVLLAEVTLAVLLFSDAARADPTTLTMEYALPARLLAIGLPLTIGLGTVVTALVLGDFSLAEAALVAAILAPTDAALGQPVVTDPSVPARVRETLNVESGLNDGLVVPVVTVLIAVTEQGEGGGAADWVRLAAEQIGIGTAVGLGVALIAGAAVLAAIGAGWVEEAYAQLAFLALAVGAWALATSLGGNGFIAAFVAGLTVAIRTDGGGEEHVLVAEDIGQLLALVAFVVFGALFVGPALGALTVPVIACAVATLTVGRMLPVAVSLIGAGLQRPTVAFIGWFGPRGLASLLFGLLLVTEAETEAGGELFTVITTVVLASVVLHGATAGPLARRYGRWYATMDEPDMAEGMAPMGTMRPRWHRPFRSS